MLDTHTDIDIALEKDIAIDIAIAIDTAIDIDIDIPIDIPQGAPEMPKASSCDFEATIGISKR